jgi:hypothetical protein
MTMRRMKAISILITVVLTLTTLIYGNSFQKNKEGSKVKSPPVKDDVVAKNAKAKGTPLVERLPADVEGVVLEDGAVKLKAGYKFVKKDNKVTVMSIAAGAGGSGGLGVGGSWDCVCQSTEVGGCSTMIVDNQIYCAPGGQPPCGGKCALSVVIHASRTKVMRY